MTDDDVKAKTSTAYDHQTLEGARKVFEELATGANSAPLAFAQAIGRAGDHAIQHETMLSDLNTLCNEVGVRGGENRIAGLRRVIDEQHDALCKMVALYESEYDVAPPFLRPDWLRSALWEDRS